MVNSAAIGIFDSGIGGLSVAGAVRELLPAEQLIYVADTGHAPYGEKTDDEIYQRGGKPIQACVSDIFGG